MRVGKTLRNSSAAATALGLLLGSAQLAGAGSPSQENAALGGLDCAEVTVDYTEDPSLTPQENLARMDQALNRSLNRFDACQITRTTSSDSGGGASGGGGGGGGAGGGAGSGPGSAASSDMAGTEAPGKAASTARRQGDELLQGRNPGASDEDNGDAEMAGKQRQGEAVPNGKVPEDIPPADNDSVLEAQIRKAAMNEEDPEVRARLWDEYRKYKGIEKNGG